MYTHELGLTQKPLQQKQNKTQEPGKKGEGEAESKAGEEERRAEPPPRVAGRSRGRGTPSLTYLESGDASWSGVGTVPEAQGARERKSGRGGPRTASAASQRPA